MSIISQFQRMSSRTIALLILLVLAIVSISTQVLTETPFRMILGLTLVLFLPGYFLVTILFPPKISLSGIEQVGTTIFLSVSILTFIGIGLNRTPYGIRLIPVLICISVFVLSASIIGHFLKPRTPDLIVRTDTNEPISDGDGNGGFTLFLQKHYEVFILSLACVLIYILNTLPYFSGENLIDVDEWEHMHQVDYVLINGHITTYSLDHGIMSNPYHYPPAFHTFIAILIQFTNFQDVFVFKWIFLAIFGPLLVLATYLMIFKYAGKKKALVTSLLIASWMSDGAIHGPLWRVPSTFSIGFFMFCLYSLAKYYDTQETSFLVTGGITLGLVLLSHILTGPILFISLSCFLFLRIVSHRTITKEDVYLIIVLSVTAVIAVVFYWFPARATVGGFTDKVWDRSWVWTNWFNISYLFLRPPLLLAPFGLIAILREYKKVDSLLLTSCYIIGFFFSFSYFLGFYFMNTRFALYWTLISYALSGLGVFYVSRFILNLRPNIRILLVGLLTAGYAIFRFTNPFSERPLYLAHKTTYDLYANFILGALILTIIVFMIYRIFENPDRLVAFFVILIMIGSSIITATFTFYYEPMMSEYESSAVLWLHKSYEPNTIVIYETKRLAWFGGELNAPISRLYGETNYSLRLIDKENILTSLDTNLTIKLLKEYHITFIFTRNGSNVSQKYKSLTEQIPHNFMIAYQNEEICIYEFLD